MPNAEFDRSEFRHDWCDKLDIYHLVGAIFPVSGNEIGVLGIHRSNTCPSYEERDRTLAGLLLPHFRRALQIRRRLSVLTLERKTALEALEIVTLRSGQLLLDWRMNFVDDAADRLGRERGEGDDGVEESASLITLAQVVLSRLQGRSARHRNV